MDVLAGRVAVQVTEPRLVTVYVYTWIDADPVDASTSETRVNALLVHVISVGQEPQYGRLALMTSVSPEAAAPFIAEDAPEMSIIVPSHFTSPSVDTMKMY